jgi:hypothetical protein
MKSLTTFIALLLSALLVTLYAAFALTSGSVLWRKSVGSSAAERIRADDVDGAARILSSASAPWWFTGFDLPVVTEYSNNAQKWLENAQDQVRSLSEFSPPAEVQARLAEVREIKASSAAAIVRLKARYQLLAAGASELFHLEIESDEPDFYSTGMLEGLPKLKGLKDDIRTLPELSAAVTNAGGVVTTTSFAADLDGLQREGKDINTNFTASTKALTAAEAEERSIERGQISLRLDRARGVAERLEAAD